MLKVLFALPVVCFLPHSLEPPAFETTAFSPLSCFVRVLCFCPPPAAVAEFGGEGVHAGRDLLPEGEAELLRLPGRLRLRHHWQEAAAAAKPDGAASGGELQVFFRL